MALWVFFVALDSCAPNLGICRNRGWLLRIRNTLGGPFSWLGGPLEVLGGPLEVFHRRLGGSSSGLWGRAGQIEIPRNRGSNIGGVISDSLTKLRNLRMLSDASA